MNSQRHACYGFSLVELVVAVALTALTSLLLLNLYDMGIRAWRINQAHISQQESLTRINTALRTVLANIYPMADRSAKHLVNFRGAPREMSFFARLTTANNGAMSKVVLRFAEENRQISLFVDWSNPTDSTKKSSSLLAKNLRIGEFSYFRGGEEQSGWRADWISQETLPDLIQIKIASSTLSWPPIIVHPKIDSGTFCRYDPVDNTCKAL